MPPQPGRIWNKVFACAFCANFLLSSALNLVNPLIANYARLLGADEVLIGLLSGLFFGVAVAARPFSGPAIAKLDKKRIMLFAYAVGVAVNAGYAFSSSIPTFIAPRILQGIQFAFIGSLNMTIAADSLPPEKMGSGLGIFGIGGATATAIAPSIGIALRSWGERAFGSLHDGYNVVFLTAAACMLISILPCSLIPNAKPSREDLSRLGVWYRNIFAREALVPAAVILFISVSSICYTIYIERLAEARGLENIGLFFTVYAVCLLSSRPLCGRLIDKYGTAKVFFPFASVYAFSFLIVGFSSSLTGVLVGGAVAAVGFGACQPSVQTMCILSVEPLRRGVASNTNYFGVDLGNFCGPVIAGHIVSRFGFLHRLFPDAASGVVVAPLYLAMALPILIAMAIFALGWGPYNRRLAGRQDAAKH